MLMGTHKWQSAQPNGSFHTFSPQYNLPLGGDSDYVNPYPPTQTPKENLSDHMQSPGRQPTLYVACHLIW